MKYRLGRASRTSTDRINAKSVTPPKYPAMPPTIIPRIVEMRMPMMPVINPPVRNEISFGKAFAKSFAGDTTFAAMLTASVATTTVNIEIATTMT